ncbi:hypothetical protein NE237_023483 [Protea cynaroides]|uniref:Cytochrome P450 n=1 Tax=Protea cynaroides TaxID=273540 RepID=A0A9Q0K4H5_9MAGN|nr:hypothetical protein NE237_023483 [Protea cynaroides]
MVMDINTLSWAVNTTALLATIILIFFFSTHIGRRQSNPPPGPKPWPIIGNLNLIGPLPHRSIHSLSQQYGPLIQFHIGSVPVVVASSISMAKELLRTHDHSFASRPRTAAGKHTFFNYSAMTWSSYGPYWRYLRKIYLTELFIPKRLDLYEKIRIEEMGLLLKRIYASSGKGIILKTYLWNANLSFVSRIVMGKKFSDEPVETLEELKKMFEELFFLNGVLEIGDCIPWLGFLDLKGYVKQMKELGKRFDGFLEKVISEHEIRRRGVEILEEKDMVDVLLRLADEPNLEVKLDRTALKGITLELLAGATESSIVSASYNGFICRVVMGKKFSDEHVEALEELKKMLEELFFLNGVLDTGDCIRWLRFLDLKGYVKQMKVLGKRFDGFLEKVISEHEIRRRGVEILEEKDMVDVFLRLVDDPNLEVKLDRTALKGITLELLAGSTESSMVSVEWAFSELLKKPETLKRATEELDRVVGRERWVEERHCSPTIH